MQITTTRLHCTAVRVAKAWKSDNTECRRGCGAAGLSPAAGGSAARCRRCGPPSGSFSQNETPSRRPLQPSRPWRLTKGLGSPYPRRSLHADVGSSFTHNRQVLEAAKTSLGRRAGEGATVHPDHQTVFRAKKNNKQSGYKKPRRKLRRDSSVKGAGPERLRMWDSHSGHSEKPAGQGWWKAQGLSRAGGRAG